MPKNQDLFELNKIMRRAQGPQRPVTAGNSQVRGAGGPPPNPQRPQPAVRRPASSSGKTGAGAGRPAVGFSERPSGGSWMGSGGQSQGQSTYTRGRQAPGPFIPGQQQPGRDAQGNPIPGGGFGGGAQLPRGGQGNGPVQAPPAPQRGPMAPPSAPQRTAIPTTPGTGPAGGGFGGGYRGGPAGMSPGPDQATGGPQTADPRLEGRGGQVTGPSPQQWQDARNQAAQSYVNPALGNVQTGPDGRPRVTLNEQGRQAYQRAYEATKRNYGRWPGSENPMSPQPKIIPGEPNFNPFNPNGWIE